MQKVLELPLSIDLGANFTGVFMGCFPENSPLSLEQLTSKASILVIPKDGSKITWSQVSRRQKRHQQRNFKRRKLAKRLIRLLIFKILDKELTPTEIEPIFGLLNRRGYNRLEAEIDWTLLEGVLPDWHAAKFPEFFNKREPLSEQFSRLIQDTNTLRVILEDTPDFWMDPKVIRKSIKEFFQDSNEVEKAHKEMQKAIKQIIASIDTGARHRREYLKNIKEEIKADKRLCKVAEQFPDPDAFYRLIGNVSNFQLRTLRWYFNDKKMAKGDYYDDSRLRQVIIRWLARWRPEEETDKRRRSSLLKDIREADSALTWLLSTDPEKTIPPYEDMNNRRPPKDATLWLNPVALTKLYGEKWRFWVERLKRTNIDWAEGINEIIELTDRKSRRYGNSESSKEEYEDAYFLQRILDRSLSLDPYKLRLLAKGAKSEAATLGKSLLSSDIGKHEVDDFINFCAAYYREIDRARSGLWLHTNSSLLEQADINPPMKKRILPQLVGNILGIKNMSKSQFQDFYDNVWIKRIGRSTIRGAAQQVEKIRKKYGNIFSALIKRAKYLESKGVKLNSDEKEAIGAQAKAEFAASAIAEYFQHTPTQAIRYANPFSIAQLYNIIETERHGFSRTSLAAHMENSWRMEMIQLPNERQAARCVRLSADSIRPFDGILARILERQAKEIAKLYCEFVKEHSKSSDHLKLPIIIEENRFSFTQELMKTKGRPVPDQLTKLIDKQTKEWAEKYERIKNASLGICAYTGQPLENTVGEIDHILPRAFSLDEHGTVFNSEANLIWVSVQGNRLKKDRRYTLSDLHDAYLSIQFGTTDRQEIASKIETQLKQIQNDAPFEVLEPEQQKALRHALFMPQDSEAFKLAFSRLATRLKTSVNGTQAWLARRIMELLTKDLQEDGYQNLEFQVMRVPANRTNQIRVQLGEFNENLAKPEQQGVFSHAVDALCALAAASEIEDFPPIQGISEEMDTLSKLMPLSADIIWIERIKPFKPWKSSKSIKLFKDGLYAENFLPIWWSDRGVRIGFDMKNCLEVSGHEPEKLLQLLSPLLEPEIPDHPPEGQPIAFRIDKKRALALLQRAAKGEISEKEQEIINVLQSLKYVTQKKEISSYFIDSSGKRKKLDKKHFRIKVNLKHPPGRGKKLFKCSGNLLLPSINKWNQIDELAREQGDNVDWQGIGRKLFRPGSKRIHKKARQTFSLPIIATMQGAYRIKRKCPFGNLLQLTMIGDLGTAGFALEESKINWKKTVPLRILDISPNCSSESPTRSGHNSSSFVALDHWVEIEPKGLNGIKKLWACPGTKDRAYVRILQDMNTFVDWMNLEEAGLSTLPAEVKPADKKALKAKFKWLGHPRSNIFMEHIGTEVQYWFIVESTTKALKDAYQKAFFVPSG